MSHSFLATVGQRPEAITVAFDLLSSRFNFTNITLIHTDPRLSGVVDALQLLRDVLAQEWPTITVTGFKISQRNGSPLLDITNDQTAMAYYLGVCELIVRCKQQGQTVHLMVAGGRKAMSIYAVLAATLLLDERDRVWTVLSPPDMLRTGVYRVPHGERDRVQLVSLPFLPSRLAPGYVRDMTISDIEQYLVSRRKRSEALLSRLSGAERRVALALRSDPDGTDSDLAVSLGLAEKTVSRHLGEIYAKMRQLFDFGESIVHPRQTLLEILRD